MAKGVSQIHWGTEGAGLYRGVQFRQFFERLRFFEQRLGFFTRAFKTILHHVNGIKLCHTHFTLSSADKAEYDQALAFKKALFAREIDVDLAVIIISAVKAYVLAAQKTSEHSLYWRVGKERVIKRDLLWVDLTSLPEIQGTDPGGEIAGFKSSDFYRELKAWLNQPHQKRESDPAWITDYRSSAFYRSVIDWLEKHGILEYWEESPPPIIPPPVQPPQPKQGSLF